jgi:mono/diheme cytochrome c family protein
VSLALVVLSIAGSARGGGTVDPDARFGGSVATILRDRCAHCHGADESSAGLRLDSYDGVMRGGERGPAVIPRNARASLLLQKILRRDRPSMPPKKALPAAEIREIQAWIAAGALP